MHISIHSSIINRISMRSTHTARLQQRCNILTQDIENCSINLARYVSGRSVKSCKQGFCLLAVGSMLMTIFSAGSKGSRNTEWGVGSKIQAMDQVIHDYNYTSRGYLFPLLCCPSSASPSSFILLRYVLRCVANVSYSFYVNTI